MTKDQVVAAALAAGRPPGGAAPADRGERRSGGAVASRSTASLTHVLVLGTPRMLPCAGSRAIGPLWRPLAKNPRPADDGDTARPGCACEVDER
jgi:hypothetical protein